MDQEGQGPVVKSQRHNVGETLGKSGDVVLQNHTNKRGSNRQILLLLVDRAPLKLSLC